MRLNKQMKILSVFTIIGFAALAVSMLQLDDSMVVFLTPVEAVEKASSLQDRRVRVGGMVKAGTLDWQPETLKLNFTLSNLKGVDIAINHHGTPPDMFKEGAGVVVEGLIAATGKKMSSSKLLVKHSEEYKKPEDHHSIDPKLMIDNFNNESY